MTRSLDPDDWAAFRQRAHEMLDASIDRMEGYSESAVWNVPTAFNPSLTDSLLGAGPGAADQALKSVLSYGVGNTHPRFFGWVHGAGTPTGLVAETIAATLNANCGGRNTGALKVERAVIDWALELFGLPETASGLITTGTSMATIVALKAARDRASDFSARREGVAAGSKLVGYTSAGAHSCLDRAFDMLGLGSEALRKVPVDDNGQMRCDALKTAIDQDQANGFTPFVICATAGTVNRGAIDELQSLADIADAQELWFHVDAAFAAALALSEDLKPRLEGISRASSIAFDFHKWMQVNYDAGCVLIRDEEAHRRAFSDRPDYLSEMDRGLASGMPWPVDYGPELSRGFRALKVWAQLIEHGPAKLGEVVERNVRQAAYLAQLVQKADNLELLSYDGLNICNFRVTRPGASEADLDALTSEIVIRLQESGIAAPSTTRIDGKLAIRVNITNHRTRMEDMDVLVEAVSQNGAALQA